MSSHLLLDRYLSGDLPNYDADRFEEHLETCGSCRKRLPHGAELERLRLGVMSRVTARPRQDLSSALWRGPLVAVLAAVVVLVLAMPVLWLDDAGPETLAEAVLPPETPASSDPFVLTFELDSGDLGWLLWRDESTWTAARLSSGPAGPSLRYLIGSRPDGMYFDTGDDSILTQSWSDAVVSSAEPVDESTDWTRITAQLLATDEDVPWSLLISTASPADQWRQLTDDAAMTASVAGNPLATSAAAGESEVAEFSEDGRLVAWRGYEATAHEHRALSATELESFTGSTTTSYAALLATSAVAEIRPVFTDALITLAEYREAAELAIACAEATGGTGRFDFPQPGGSGSLDLGDRTQCAIGTFDPVHALWRLQVRADGPESLDTAQAIINGDSERLAMLATEPGPRFLLAKGEGWRIEVAPRGDGWCVYGSALSTTGEYCSPTSAWTIPDVLDIDVSDNRGGQEGLLGVASDTVVTVVVRFSSGAEERLETQGVDGVSIRGFGMVYEMDDLGFPEIIESYDSNDVPVQVLNLLNRICRRQHGGPEEWCD